MGISRSKTVLLMVVLGGQCLVAGCGAPKDAQRGPKTEDKAERPNPLRPEPDQQVTWPSDPALAPPVQPPAPVGPIDPRPVVREDPAFPVTLAPAPEPVHPIELQPFPREDPAHSTALAPRPRPSVLEAPLAVPRPSLIPREALMEPEGVLRMDDGGPRAPLSTMPVPDNVSALPDEVRAEPFMMRLDPDESEPESARADVPTEADPPESAAEESPKPTGETSDDEDYSVVTVFYGTDRAVVDTAGPELSETLGWLTPTLAVGGVAMLLLVVALRLYPNRATRSLAGLAVAATLVLGCLLVCDVAQIVPAWWQSDRPGPEYGNERGDRLELGTCDVSIPKDHRVGELEAPSIVRLEFTENPEKHITVLEVEPKPVDEFFAEMKARVGQSKEKSAFVFVHGFNVTFEAAAHRTAQMAYDLEFDGAPIFYSWPSKGQLSQYTVDETNVVWTEPHLKEFLTGVADRSGARQIHLIAHSMGNRALTRVLRALSYRPDGERPKFHEVVLTAPDIDADVFKRDIAPRIVKTAKRVTLYASSNDWALAYSKKVHGHARAGDSGAALLVIPGIDTIDVSAVDTSLIGHSYYGSNDTVLADLFALLREAKSPDQREWLRPQLFGTLTYWIFQSDRTSAAPSAVTAPIR